MKRKLTFKSTIIVILFIIFITGFIRQELTLNRIRKEIIVSQEELEVLKDENFKLQAELDSTPSDEYLEKLARERLGMVKKGEIVVSPQEGN